jgi:hypothetical protein
LSFRWLELEGEPAAEALLQRLTVPIADLPIVVVPGGELLRNPSSRALLSRWVGTAARRLATEWAVVAHTFTSNVAVPSTLLRSPLARSRAIRSAV